MSWTIDWQIWTAGIVTSESVRNLLISSVVKYVSDAKNGQPLGDLYDSITGVQVPNSGHARPVVGGHLALVSPPNLMLLPELRSYQRL